MNLEGLDNFALTFDDILLVPQYSEVIPTEITTKTFFARDLFLNMPIISAAMDTVTENRVATTMAQHGGFGVIHKNLSPKDQAHEVEKVKKYESGMITDPISLGPDHLVIDAIKIMREYSISGVPITVSRKLVGILTNRDLRFETNVTQPIKNVMTSASLITAKRGTTLAEAKIILQKHRIEKLPVVDEAGKLEGLITIKDIQKAESFPLATKDKTGRLFVGAAVGVDKNSHERVQALVNAGVDLITVDSAHGHSKNILEMVEYIHKTFPEVYLVGGNVVTAEGTEALINKGADVVKVGVGPGSICTTRIVSGVGMPQISAVKACAEAARKHNKTVIADGGIKFSGDITKSLALGANTVMIGKLLAGTDESPGEVILYQGRTYKVYRGMGSIAAMTRGSKDRYGQKDVNEQEKLVPEGIEGRVPYKGSVSAILHQLAGGLKSGMGYLGAPDIKSLQERARFVRISPHGSRESHVHDVTITKEAPNYRLE